MIINNSILRFLFFFFLYNYGIKITSNQIGETLARCQAAKFSDRPPDGSHRQIAIWHKQATVVMITHTKHFSKHLCLCKFVKKKKVKQENKKQKTEKNK